MYLVQFVSVHYKSIVGIAGHHFHSWLQQHDVSQMHECHDLSLCSCFLTTSGWTTAV